MHINKRLSIPLYRQIEHAIEKEMYKEEWEPGFRLPTEKELAKHFDVSAITVKRGIHELVNRGLLYRERGRGTFVNIKKKKNISEMVTFRTSNNDEKEFPHKTISFELNRAGENIGKALQINPEDNVYSIVRIKLDDNVPVCIEYTYIPEEKVKGLNSLMLEEDLIYNVFTNDFKLELKKAKIFISTISAGEFESDILDTPIGSQLFVLKRYTFDIESDLIEYSSFIVKQDNFNYFIEINL